MKLNRIKDSIFNFVPSTIAIRNLWKNRVEELFEDGRIFAYPRHDINRISSTSLTLILEFLGLD